VRYNGFCANSRALHLRILISDNDRGRDNPWRIHDQSELRPLLVPQPTDASGRLWEAQLTPSDPSRGVLTEDMF
jgi:hypothetical protein